MSKGCRDSRTSISHVVVLDHIDCVGKLTLSTSIERTEEWVSCAQTLLCIEAQLSFDSIKACSISRVHVVESILLRLRRRDVFLFFITLLII